MAVDLSLYALVDPAVAGGRTLVDLARRLTASATLVQLRDKHGSTRLMIEEARDLRYEMTKLDRDFLRTVRIQPESG